MTNYSLISVRIVKSGLGKVYTGGFITLTLWLVWKQTQGLNIGAESALRALGAENRHALKTWTIHPPQPTLPLPLYYTHNLE